MKRIISILALVATVSLGFAQETPKAKAAVKKETCKKGSKCCKSKAAAAEAKK